MRVLRRAERASQTRLTGKIMFRQISMMSLLGFGVLWMILFLFLFLFLVFLLLCRSGNATILLNQARPIYCYHIISYSSFSSSTNTNTTEQNRDRDSDRSQEQERLMMFAITLPRLSYKTHTTDT